MSARGWLAFLAVATLWGIPYYFIKIAVDAGVSPAFLAWIRVAIAALLLGALSWRLGLLGGLRGRWRILALYATIEIAIPFPLIGFGEQRISSSLTAILIASVPLIVAVLALRFDHAERATGARLLGLLIGFAGVVALVGIDLAGESSELIGAGAVLLAALGYAIGPMLLKRELSEIDPRALMAGALALAALVLSPAALATAPASVPSNGAIVSIIALSVLCTATAFVLFAILIVEVGPSRAAVITYVAPVVAVGLGVTLLGERPGPGTIAGLLLILAGSWLSTGGRRSGEPPPGAPAIVAGAPGAGDPAAPGGPGRGSARARGT